MTKIDSIPQAKSIQPSPGYDLETVNSLVPDLKTAHRLIVLFPSSALDAPNLSHRIWEIASSSGLDVLFFSLCNDFGEESQLRRKLGLMAAMIKDGNVNTEVMILYGSNWVRELKNILRPEDVIAGWRGHKVGLLHRDLDKLLRSAVNVPMFLLSENPLAKTTSPANISNAISWAGSIAIIGAFFWGEAKIIQLSQDWAHTSLLYLGIFFEVGLLWVWNSIFG